jgi:hypothetical protein
MGGSFIKIQERNTVAGRPAEACSFTCMNSTDASDRVWLINNVPIRDYMDSRGSLQHHTTRTM